MKAKDRLSLQFTFLFAALLLIVLSGIYLFVDRNRISTFFNKLDDRAFTVGQFYLAEDNLSKENFDKVIQKFPLSLSGESIRIYDDRYHPKFIPEGNIRWDRSVLEQVIQKKRIHLSTGDRQTAGLYYVDNSGNFIIMISADDLSGFHQMHVLSLIMIFFFLASLLVTFLTGRIFSRFALLPVVNITKRLKRIRASSLNLRLPADRKKIDEIDNLSLTINQLLEHLEQSFESQQLFISNASHELRTPITTILGESEISLLRDRTSEQYQSTLQTVIKETERLNHIINSLIELVQVNVENNDFHPVRVDQLLWEIKREWLTNANLDIEILNDNHQQDAVYTTFGNKQLLRIAISNIIKNALKFSKGTVYSVLFHDENGINLLVRDQGIGINAKDINKIFQPFFRAQNALNYSGNGIGLSLTQNIIRLHSGAVHVKSQLNQGSEFHIILPAYS